MGRCDYEPTLAEVLTDPLVRRLMAADRVDAHELARRLGVLAAVLRKRRG
jgi:hypothetical protein